ILQEEYNKEKEEARVYSRKGFITLSVPFAERWFIGMKKKIIAILCAFSLAPGVLAGCGQNQEQTAQTSGRSDEKVQEGSQERTEAVVIVSLPTTSEPASGLDPAYGWGAGEHVHEPLIQSTLTVTNQDLEIGLDLAADYHV